MAPAAKEVDSVPLLDPERATDEVTTSKMSCYKRGIRRLFLHDRHADFALDAELACRSSIGLLFLGLPFLVPHGAFPVLDKFKGTGLYGVTVVTFYMFNVKKTLGDTISSCFGCLRGLSIAVLYTWGLHFFFPQSVTEDSPPYVFWIGVAYGAVFISAVMVLKVNPQTKIVATSNFIGWWMNFLKPGDDNYHFPFGDYWDPYKDAGLSALVTTLIGTTMSIMGCLLPYPLVALDHAKESTDELVFEISKLWKLFADYMGAGSRHPYMQDRVFRNLQRLERMAEGMTGHVDSSWWECFGLGRRQVVRKRLRRLDEAIKESYDCIYAVWAASEGAEWHEKHTSLMSQIGTELGDLIQAVESLSLACLASVTDDATTISDSREQEINGLIAKVESADKQLFLSFRKARKSAGLSLTPSRENDEEPSVEISDIEELALPHVLVFNLSKWASAMQRFAKGLVESKINPNFWPKPDDNVMVVLRSLFDGITAFEYRNFVLRTLSCIFIGFFLGFHGFRDMIVPYEARIASTAVLLVSKFAGSAVVKNLQRVQGVVLGMIFGQIVKKVFGSCAWTSVVPLIVTTFIFAYTMVFVVHRASPTLSNLGCLAAIFGIQNIMSVKCAAENEDIAIDKEGAYNAVVVNLIACMLVAAIDMVLYPGRASTSACERLDDCFVVLEDALKKDLDPQVILIRGRNNAFFKGIEDARNLNDDAATEPRFWRTSWKQDVFDNFVRSQERIRYNLRTLESCLANDNRLGDAKDEVMIEFLRLPSCQLLAKRLLEKVDIVRKLSGVLMHETTHRFELAHDEAAQKVFRDEVEQLRRDAAGELKHLSSRQQGCIPKTLRQDHMCRIVVALVAVKAMFQDLRKAQHETLRVC